MKKENFVKVIDAIVSQKDRNHAFGHAMSPFFEGFVFSSMTDDLENILLDVLEEEMEDPEIGSKYGSIISWWLYDAPSAGKNKDLAHVENPDGTKILLHTSSQLYDYLDSFGVK